MPSDTTRTIPPNVADLLSRLRARIRAYVWVEGIAALLIVLGVAFWVGLALDWLLEPPPFWRVLGACVVAIIFLFVAYRFILRRAFARLNDASLALLIERKFKTLQDRLLTSIELANPGAADEANPALIQHAANDADAMVGDVRLAKIFDFRPLSWMLGVAAISVASIVVFGMLSQEAFGFWMRRIGLTEELWPRRVSLVVDGFDADASGVRVEKLARDDEFELTVRALLTDRFVAPKNVEIRYTTADGQRGRDVMTQVGAALPGHDAHQVYRYTFKNVASDLTFDIVGEDDRIRDLRLAVVDRPNLIDMRLHCVYPDYIGRAPETLDVTGTMSIPEGTEIEVRATATKPLARMRARTLDGSVESTTELDAAADARNVAARLPALRDDVVLMLSLRDTDGIETREPIRVAIAMLDDAPPDVAVRLEGIGAVITPDARIPLVGTISDPRYGVAKCWLDGQVDGAPAVQSAFAEQAAGRQEIRVAEALDARAIDAETKQRALSLSPGQRLTIRVQASDEYDLADAPHVGSSPPFTLEVVTPDKLRSLLEQRELSLRQRFETLVEKTRDTRRLLARVEMSDENPLREPSDAADTEENSAPTEPERVAERRRLRIASAKQSMTQVAQETLGVAESFDQIQAELINNRVDTEEMLGRLRDEIAAPLREIAIGKIPVLETQLDVVQSKADAGEDETDDLRESEMLVDEILVAMEGVLDRMLELESYNEVLDLLRTLIEDEAALNERTKEKQREQLKKLLEGDG